MPALSVVLLTFAFVACGGGGETKVDSPTATTGGDTPTAASPAETPAAGSAPS